MTFGIKLASIIATAGLVAGLGIGAGVAAADVTPASLFTDHMVLQRGMATPVWGTAAAGEKVTVSVAGKTESTIAGGDGKWMVRLNNLEAGGPHELTLAGNNSITFKDVYIGEVWLASGQSNMDFTVANTPKYYFAGVDNEAAEIAAANYPKIRMFTGQTSKKYTPQTSIDGEWKVCNPENVREMSAVGYFFARDLQKSIDVPVGIVTMTFGASTAEAWIRREALEPIPEMKAELDKLDIAYRAVDDAAKKKYEEARAAWEVEAAKAKAAGEKAPRGPRNPDPAQDQHKPTVMFNGMIAPAIPYGIKGVIWYQGESVAGGPAGIKLYPQVQAALVNDWRKLWNNPELPFYIVQLSSQKARSNNPDIRAAQATILSLLNTGMAVTIDIGNPTNVHPKNKQDVGARLARIALAKAYGQAIEYSGPAYEKMSIEGQGVEGQRVRVRFTHATDGLVAKDSTSGELKWFEIAGSDGKFVPAEAKIDGDSVVVSSPTVPEPTAVRYAWHEWPEGANLFNKTGLPAAPFTSVK
ncbi:MAG: sialate O-acetylesterase [Burkholderiales bacterium]|nr:sialate O-acetylesterase [Phycisphaerae bacterium]